MRIGLALQTRREAFTLGLITVIAGLTGLDFDALWGRERRRRAPKRVAATGMPLIAFAFVGTMLTLLVRAKNEADSETLVEINIVAGF
jgi:hypothetical protein